MARVKKDAAPEPAGEMTTGATEKRMSQREAVRRAMEVKGDKAHNDVLQAHILEAFQMNVKKQSIATLKSQIRAESRRAGRARLRGPEGYSLDDLQMVQGLVRRIGASRVRDMVDLFDK